MLHGFHLSSDSPPRIEHPQQVNGSTSRGFDRRRRHGSARANSCTLMTGLTALVPALIKHGRCAKLNVIIKASMIDRRKDWEAAMHVRITHYRMKPESIEAATAILHEMKEQIMALPGLKQFINSINSDGKGCVVALVESREISDANEPAVQALWAHYADHLLEAPKAEGYDVIVDWSTSP